MGIRYFAYATQPDDSDPDRELPDKDWLDLDKAWRPLQELTRPDGCIEEARPAFRMFDGEVRMCPGYGCWEAWTRTIAAEEVPAIALDLRRLHDELHELYPDDSDGDAAYVRHFLAAAVEFTTRLAFEGRGFTYRTG